MSLENLIPYSPQLNDTDNQLILYGMAEFQTLEATKSLEKRVRPGEYFKHQIIVSRLMLLKDRLLIIHKQGTGKSCTFVAFDELVKETTDIFHEFYTVTSKSLIDTMKRQIICKCTNNKYINDKGSSKAKAYDVRNSGKQSFKNNYNLMTYGEMNGLIVGKTVAQLREMFNYAVFNFDEITEIINISYSNVVDEISNNGTVTWHESVNEKLKALKYISNLDDPSIINSDIEYIQLWRLFHAVINAKIMIASATPTKNRLAEFFLLCNLLLPLNRQFDLDEFPNHVFTYNLKKYRPYLTGLISYVDSSSIVANKNFKGCKLDYSYLVEYPTDDTSENPTIGIRKYDSEYVVYKYELYGYQNRKIFQFKDEVFKDKIGTQSSQFTCYVDTNLNFGTDACNKYDLSYLSASTLNGNDNRLQRIINRMNTCAGFSEVYRIECDRLENSKINGDPGPCPAFLYLTLTETVIAPLRELFKTDGKFEVLYKDEHFNFLKRKTGDYCNIGELSSQGLTKRPRAVFLSSTINEKIRELIIELTGAAENIHGEYIQFLTGSEVMGTGVNVRNTMVFYRKLPEWNEANDGQTSARVFREDGHDNIREYLANKKSIETGTHIDKYEIDLSVDVYNMCAFSRFFYISKNNAIELYNKEGFVNDIFELLSNGDCVIIPDKSGRRFVTLNTSSIIHFIGFTKSSNITKIYGKQLTEFCIIGDIAYEKISEKLGIDININLDNLFNDEYTIIFSFSGVIYISKFNDQLNVFLKDKNIIYHENANFTKNYTTGYYENECKLVSLYPNDEVKYKLYNLNMEYLSPNELQYNHMEKKSFGSRRLLRIAKIFSDDKLLNNERTYNDKMVDGSLECDFDTCKYKGISEIFNTKSADSFIYEKGPGTFFTNYEVLYSAHIINECKANIISMFTNKNKVKLSHIFNVLMPQYKREYFVNMAIYQIISEKYKLKDSFGFNVYICATKDELFLSRDYPRKLLYDVDSIGDYTKKLIAITNNNDFRNINTDDDMIKEIEEITVPDGTADNVLMSLIIQKIDKLSYISIVKLLERCFGRIAYDRNKKTGFLQINDEYNIKQCDLIICSEIYSLRCYSYEGTNGYIVYYHNQPSIKNNDKQGEISRLINAEDKFRNTIINNGKIEWVNSTPEQNQWFKDKVKMSIRENIDTLLTKNYFDSAGTRYAYKSKYYVTYYLGTYRLSESDSYGRDFSSITMDQITPCVTYLSEIFGSASRNGIYRNDVDNNRIYTLINELLELCNKRDLKTLRVKLKEYFNFAGLIFYFSIQRN